MEISEATAAISGSCAPENEGGDTKLWKISEAAAAISGSCAPEN